MLYSDTKNFIFVHIYKTAGKSVNSALRKHCPIYLRNIYLRKCIRLAPGPARWVLGWRAVLANRQHMTAEQIRTSMPPELFDAATKFAFVRNPWDWQVSEYFYAVQSKAHPYHEQVRGFGDFETYIRHKCSNDPRLQCSFIFDRDGDRLVDHVGRFESLNADFRRICGILGLDESLPHTNASNRKRDWRTYYTDTTYELVREAYRLDIETFGYDDAAPAAREIPSRLTAPEGWYIPQRRALS